MASLNSAIKLHQEGQIDAAERAYREILATSPRDANALHLLGVVHQQQGRHEEAKELIASAIAINPAQAVYHCNYGAALLSLNQYSEAGASFHRALSIRPSYADAYANLGMMHAATDNEPDAEVCFRRALEYQAWHRDATIRLSRLLERQCRFEEASQLLEATIAASPCAQFHLALGNLLVTAGQAQKAAVEYRSAILGSITRREPVNYMSSRFVYGGCNEAVGQHLGQFTPSHSSVGGNARKIAFVSPHCLLDFTNGAATATLDGLKLLARLGFECEVFCGSRLDTWGDVSLEETLAKRAEPYTDHDALIDNFRARMIFTSHCGLPITLVDISAARESIINSEVTAAFVTGCEAFLDKTRPDLLWTYGGDALALVVQQAARQRDISVLFGLHNFSYDNAAPFQMADRIVVPTEFARRHYRITLGLECDVLPVAIDLGRTLLKASFDAEQANAPSEKFVTFVNPTLRKGVFVFTRIAELIAQRRPDILLLLVEGASKSSHLRQLGIDLSGIKSLRTMPNTPDARQFLAVTKLLLMPSLMDNAAMLAREAMFNGIPVLASNRGGLPETIGDAGVLFDIPSRYTQETRDLPTAEEMEPWVETIIRLWDDVAEYDRWSQAAREHAQQWHPDRLTPIYRAFFGNITIA